MNIEPLPDALGLQEDAARAPGDDLRTQITELQGRLHEAETHLEHLAITRKTVTALADRLPTQGTSPEPPDHPDYPRILAVFNEVTGPLRARDVCEALDHELLPKNIESARAKLKRLVKLGILTEIDPAASPGSCKRPRPATSSPAPTSPGNGHQLTNRPLRTRPDRHGPVLGTCNSARAERYWRTGSVVVPVPVVQGVAVPVVDVVHVVTVRYGDVPASGLVPVVVILVDRVARRLALVGVVAVDPVKVPVVHVVDMVAVRYRDVAAVRPVLVRVVRVSGMSAGQHGRTFSLPRMIEPLPTGKPAPSVLTTPGVHKSHRELAGIDPPAVPGLA